jgi:hypothetical protein
MKEPARRFAGDGECMDGTTYQKPEPDYSLVPDSRDCHRVHGNSNGDSA